MNNRMFGAIGVLVIVVMTSVGCESTPAVSAKNEPAKATEVPAADVPAKEAPKPPAAAPEATSWQGTGPTDTSSFYAAGPSWQLHYKAPAGAPNAATEFQVFVQRADTGRMLTLAVNQHGAAEGMVAVPSPPGTYYLRVLTAGPWQLSVSDLIPAVPAKAAEPAPAPATKKAP